MDIEDPARDDNQQDNSGKYNNTIGDVRKFNIQLTVSQANAVDKILPKAYSLQLQRQAKTKRANPKKKTNTVKKQAVSNPMDIEEPSERISKTKSAQRYNQEMANLSLYSRAASQNYYEEVEDFMKPCLRILHMLKNHKTSWPFREPVDPIALNIPNYLDIIKQPMDLQTVQKNLKTKVYVTPTQFHADIGKIVRNSYQFNKNNPDFIQLTRDFQNHYNKIRSDSTANRSTVYQNPISNVETIMQSKKKKSKTTMKSNEPRPRQVNMNQPVTLAQKKILTQQISRLSLQHMKQIVDIVYEGKSPHHPQLDINVIPAVKLRQIQRYLQDKAPYLQMNLNNQKKKESQMNNQNRDEESSFQSDSDS